MTRILLLNFSETESKVVSNAGYDVERGFLGFCYKEQWPCQFPRPIYEYDVLFYNSWVTSNIEAEFTRQVNLWNQKGNIDSLCNFNGAPHFRVSFVGQRNGLEALTHGGLRFVQLETADLDVSVCVHNRACAQSSFAVPEIHKLVTGFTGEVKKIGQFVSAQDVYPFHHFFPLMVRNGKFVAGYGATSEDKDLPRYIVLPQLERPERAIVEILSTLEQVWPALFPERAKNVWIESEEFLLPEERAKDIEIQRVVEEATATVERLRSEKDALVQENSFVRDLLTATEDPTLEATERLSGVVRKALEFLGFSVQDNDEKTKSALRKEDFWVSDGDFFAITEVSGTAATNPKVKEFNDILARIATIYKRKTDLIPKSVSNISGLLVLNYDCERRPLKRPKVYTGELEHIVETAKEQSIDLLSTVELHRLVVDVKKGNITKEAARSFLKQAGRIEYPAPAEDSLTASKGSRPGGAAATAASTSK